MEKTSPGVVELEGVDFCGWVLCVGVLVFYVLGWNLGYRSWNFRFIRSFSHSRPLVYFRPGETFYTPPGVLCKLYNRYPGHLCILHTVFFVHNVQKNSYFLYVQKY